MGAFSSKYLNIVATGLSRFIVFYALFAAIMAGYFIWQSQDNTQVQLEQAFVEDFKDLSDNWKMLKINYLVDGYVSEAFSEFDEKWTKFTVNDEKLLFLDNFSSLAAVRQISEHVEQIYAMLLEKDLDLQSDRVLGLFIVLDSELNTLFEDFYKFQVQKPLNSAPPLLDAWLIYLLFVPLILSVVANCAVSKLSKIPQESFLLEDKTYSYLDKQKLNALDVMAEGIILINYDGLIDYLNPAAQSIFAAENKQVKKQPWYSLLPEDNQLSLKKDVLSMLDEKGFWHEEIEVNISGDGAKTLDINFFKLKDEGIAGIVRDISEQKLREKEASELRKQFFQAQKMESIGRMAGGIAHDFNNILSAIMGYAEFLEEDLPEGSMEQSFAKKILAASKQAKNLINQILSFSRKNSGEKMPVDLNHLLQVTNDMVKSSAPTNIDILMDSQIKDAFIEGNPTEVSQVLMNLCVNARDAMEDKQGSLNLNLGRVNLSEDEKMNFAKSAHLDEKDSKAYKTHIVNKSDIETFVYVGNPAYEGEYFKLEIADTGSGILPAIIEQIFEPFFTTKDQDKGTGLGLSSSLGIIVSHGGMLKLRSIVGEGSSFSLYFPANSPLNVDVSAPEASSSGHNDDAPEMARPRDEKKQAKVLLVDDDDNVRETMKLMLTRLGLDVVDYGNPLEAVAHFAEHEKAYDIVISDYMMPEIKGGELAQAISEMNEDLPIIIISGFAEDSFEKSLSDFPFIRAFLKKPLQKEDIKAALEELNIL